MSNLERPYKILIQKNGVEHDAASVSVLDDGEIAVVKQDGSILTAGDTISDSEFIYIVQGTADAPKFSAKIKGASVKKYTGSAAATAVEQISFIGSNGTVGGMEGGTPLDNQEYSLHLVIKGLDKDLYSKRQLRKSFHYTTDGGATEEELVDGLLASLAADSMIQLAGSTKTGAVIEVSKVGTAGIKLEGLAVAKGAYDEEEQVIFEIALDKGFTIATQVDELGYIYVDGAAPTTTDAASSAPTRGNGTYNHVSDLEEFAQGFNGITNKTGFPIPAYPKYAVAGTEYDLFVIEHDSVHASGNLEQAVAAPLMTIVACIKRGDDSATAKGGVVLEAALNPYMASTPGAFASVGF